MARGIAALALLAVALLLSAGIWAIDARVGAVRSTLADRSVLARALLLDNARAPDLIRRLEDPNVHVVVEDHANNVVYDWHDGTLNSHPIPPMPPGAPLPNGPIGAQPPPGVQPPPGAQPPIPPSPIDRILGSAIGRQPERINGGDRISVIVAPDLETLRRFVTLVVSLTALSLAVAIAAAIGLIAKIVRDERNRLEATLEERRAAAREFQRFLADAGHELRTPLTIVSGYVEILSAELAATPNGAQILGGLRDETARMRALVEKMLLLARLESPVSVPRLLDAGSVAADVVKQMQARYPSRELLLHADEPASIVIDQDDLHEAIRNLVENGIRYAPSSPVEIDITSIAGNASIVVTDRGAGIEQEEREKIFDRFYRGSAQTGVEGSGLGLAIVSRVASRWKGTIALDSSPGRTAFTLRFPLADEVPI